MIVMLVTLLSITIDHSYVTVNESNGTPSLFLEREAVEWRDIKFYKWTTNPEPLHFFNLYEHLSLCKNNCRK